jgi:hypothetical protein
MKPFPHDVCPQSPHSPELGNLLKKIRMGSKKE